MRKKTLLFLASLLAVAQGAWADGIKYLEREWVDGALVTTEKTVTDYSPFTPNSFYYDADIYWLRGGYFVANTDCTISRDIMVANDVHIILMDGVTVKINSLLLIAPSNYTLHIHAQSDGENMGKLIVNNKNSSKPAIGLSQGDIDGNKAAIYIHGGDITATGSQDAAGIGGGNGYGIGRGGVNIYGGKVTATGGEAGAGIGGGLNSSQGGPVNIYGGTVNAKGGEAYIGFIFRGAAAGIGGGNNGDGGEVNIYGGNVTATGTGMKTNSETVAAAGIGGGDTGAGGTVRILGGTVRAIHGGAKAGDTFSAPIGQGWDNHSSDNGILILSTNQRVLYMGSGDNEGYANAADRIDACQNFPRTNDYSSWVQLEPCTHSVNAQTPENNGYHHYDCTWCYNHEAHTFDAYNYCSGCNTVLLKNDTDNSAAISNNAGNRNVILDGSLFKTDGCWNTLCLPFGIESLEGTKLEGAIVKTLESTSFADGTLILNFTKDADNITSIEAGKPYIVKWEKTSDYDDVPFLYDIQNPIFLGVTVSDVTEANRKISSGMVDFVGLFTNKTFINENNTTLVLGGDNKLFYPSGVMGIDAFHAYLLAKTNLGDVNGDGEVNVTDVTILVNNILGNADDKFIIDNADINGDGSVNVTDATALVNIILLGSSNDILNVVITGADDLTFGGSGNEPARTRKN